MILQYLYRLPRPAFAIIRWAGFCRRSMLFNRIIRPFLRTVFVVRHIKKQAEMNMEAADVYMRFRRSQENGDIINITLI